MNDLRDAHEPYLFPTSFAQERLWFLDQFEPESFIYNIPSTLLLQGPISLSALLQSINTLVQRHETLRTTFVSIDGHPLQSIAQSLYLDLPVIDLSTLQEDQCVVTIQRLAQAEAQRIFHLVHGPLIRTSLLRLAADKHLLLFTIHHIIADAWSTTIFVKELNILYTALASAKPASLPELSIQYADYAAWQREWLQGETLEQELAYWKKQLAGAPAVLELPTDHSRPAIQSYRGNRYSFTLSAPLAGLLETLSRKRGVTLFMTLLAAFQTLLFRFSGVPDVVVGTPIAGRTQTELEGLIGFFVNTLVLRSDLSANPTFSDLLSQVREMSLEAFAHQELPFDRVVEALQPERSLSHHPLFQVLFAFQKIPPLELSAHMGQEQKVAGGTRPSSASIPSKTSALRHENVTINMGIAKFDLSLFFWEEEDGLAGEFEYNTDLFEQTTIERWSHHLQTLLESIAFNPEQQLLSLPLLETSERLQLLDRWSITQSVNTSTLCLHQLFERQVVSTPDAISLVNGDGEQLTYSAINQRANQLAHHLRHLGLGPEQRVGIFLERSTLLVIGLLAILKAGAAYVPIDPAYPAERIAFLLKDAEASTLLTQQEYLGKLSEISSPVQSPTGGAMKEHKPQHSHSLFIVPVSPKRFCGEALDGLRLRVLCLDQDWEHYTHELTTNVSSGVLQDNLAYIIYTSGSTGKPKGVGICHQQVVRLFTSTQQLYQFQARDCWTLFHSIAFDFSVWELWGALLYGGRLLVVPYWISRTPTELITLLAQEQVTILNQTPSAFDALQQALTTHPFKNALLLRLVIFGGEALDTGRLRSWMETHRDTEPHFVNMYGITETTVHVTATPLSRQSILVMEEAHSSIGTPLPDLQLFVLDTQMQPTPVGIRGELYVGGPALARGYVGHPDLTAERFVPHPFSTHPGARLYRTGDLARFLPDHTFEYMGRADQQVKVRGFRIELGEIEAALLEHPQIQAAVVLLREITPGQDKRLIAYLVAMPEQILTIHNLRSYLHERLPDYMLPASFVQLEALPMTHNGKLDRQALLEPELIQPDKRTYTAPRTQHEQILSKIWTEVLKVKQVDIHTNFFEAGGDSILSLLVIARAKQAGLLLTPKQIFQHQTIADLASVASTTTPNTSKQETIDGPVPLLPIQHWFFGQNLPDPQHWNQSVLLEVLDPRITLHCLQQAVAHLLEHHDIFSLRFIHNDTAWEQQRKGANTKASITDIVSSSDLSTLSPAEQERTLEAEATLTQGSLNLTEGPLFRAVYFVMDEHQPNRLLLVIHHLIVDGVSWRILQEDLQITCQQIIDEKVVRLPPKTTSFTTWAAHLQAYAQSPEVQQEATYWLAANRHMLPALPVDFIAERSANIEASAQSVHVSLSRAETDALLHEAASAYHTQINELLLAALVLACSAWTGKRKLLVDVEGHGREAIFDDVDLSRTIGWFTTIFPVLLDLENTQISTGMGNVIKTIKEQVRNIPHNGLGYGLLRYLSNEAAVRTELIVMAQADISFNYLGQFNLAPGDTTGNMFHPARESSGPSHSLHNPRRYLLDITGIVRQGQFHMEWRYSTEFHRPETIETLTQQYMDTLRNLITHCCAPQAGGYTPSDFSGSGLSQSKLDKIMTKIRSNKKIP